MEFKLYSKSVSGKFIKRLFTCLLTIAGCAEFLQIGAQGSPGLVSCGYVFSAAQLAAQGAGTNGFPFISGPTTLTSSAGMTNMNYTIDLSAVTPAFNFDFNGVLYNKFGINTNGFVWLGNTAPPATTTQPIALAGTLGTTPDGIISGWGVGLQGLAAGSITYAVTGTSPNRTLTIQWNSVQFQSANGTSQNFNMQIVLNENDPGGATSNVINFIYSDQYPQFISKQSGNVQIGLRGNTNTDFNDRVGTGGGGFGWFYNSTSLGTASTSGITFVGGFAASYIGGIIKFTYTPTLATPTISGGPATWCAGSSGSVLLTANTTIPSPAYQWQAYTYPPPNTNITGQTGSTYTANPDTAGIILYVVQVSNASGCYRTSYPDTVTVTTCAGPCSPPLASYNNPVCVGDTLKLNASTVPNVVAYGWTGPNGFTSSSQDTFITNVTLADTGAYSVIATYDTCVSIPAVVDVVINPIPSSPVAGSNSPVCASDSIKLTASVVAGAVYNWTGPNTFNNNQNPVKANASANDGGTYSVVAVVNGCSSVPATTNLTITPAPSAPVASSNSPICTGDTLNLSASTITNATYNWTGPNNFTNQQSPTKTNIALTDSGTYSVIATVNGCKSVPATTKVVVNPIPAAPTASSNTPICSGGTLNLFASTITNATYNWTGPNNFTNQQNPSKANVTTGDAGSYNVVVTVNGCKSPIANTTVVVNSIPLPPTASSNSPLCVGDTLNLSASTISNATYNWTGPNNFTNQQNPSKVNITLADAGTYSVIATVNGCNSIAAGTVVVVNSIPVAPTASSNSPVCSGGTLNLFATTVTNATYNWTGPNNFTNQQNPTKANVTSADAGTYSLIAAVNGCNSVPATTNVVINTTPSAPTASSNSPLCVGGTLNLSAGTIANAIYNWTGPNNFTNQQNPTKTNIVLSDSGTYSVIATVNGCSSTAATTEVVVNPIPASPNASSNSPVCTGGTLNLSASTITNATYNWTGPNNFTNQQNPTKANVTTGDAGTYSVIATVNGCGSAPATTGVVINTTPSAPSASSNSPICAGDTMKLSAGTIANATYNWTGPNDFINQQNPFKLNAALADSGTYSVIVTVNGCNSAPTTTDVVIHFLPTTPVASSNSPLCTGGTLNLSATTITNATYNWTGPNNFTNQQNPAKANVTTADAGTYSVVATVNGCISAPSTTSVVINATPATPVASSNSPVCTAGALNLSADTINGVTYNWTGPNNFIANQRNPIRANVVPLDSGFYILVATLGNCSSQPDSTRVIIDLPPSAPMLSSNSPICEGTTLNLNSGTVAGATYSWTGPNNFNNQQQSPSITDIPYADSGTYTLVATVGPCTSPAATINVAVNQTPVLTGVISNSPICYGTTLNLSADSITGAIYNWTGPDTFSSTRRNPARTGITYADSGTYTLTASIGSCSGTPVTTSVWVKPNPIPPMLTTARDTICAGDSAQVCTAIDTFVNYLWNTGTNGVSCTYATVAGNYWVTVTSANGCIAISNHLAINVYAVSSISVEVVSDTLIAFDGTSYQWFLNDTALAGDTNYFYIASKSGLYSVEITDYNGCVAGSGTIDITGVSEPSASMQLEVYPNPSSGKIEVSTGSGCMGCDLEIFDDEGRMVSRSKVSGQKQEIDISSLAKGMYVLQVAGDSKKFIRE